MKQLVKSAYNRCAGRYGLERDVFKNKKQLDWLIKRLAPGAKILDIGCGAGVPVDKYLVEKGHLVTGVDISEKQVELARKNIPKASFLVKEMTEMGFEDGSFDAVVSFYAIFHIPREEHFGLLRKINFLLKPGGRLLITMGNEEWEGSEQFCGVEMYWSHYGKDKNLELVKEAGFRIEESEVDDSGGEHHLVVLAKKPPIT